MARVATLYLNLELDAATIADDGGVSIRGDEARHAATVSRARVGERIGIGNGRGLIAWGAIASLSAAEVEIEVDEIEEIPSAVPRIVLVQALAKGDRDELAVQAATELGVDRVVPWAAERSISRWDGAKAERGRVRWESIVREATKQSIRAWVPEVEPLQTTRQLAARAHPGMLVLDPRADAALSEIELGGIEAIELLVGPEGGISEREVTALTEAGARAVRLGASVLRTSTAGPAALAALATRLGRW